ncbi:aldehyde dehydrogenase family protein [Candidatus Gottesmanbacteria bacterium]|nr:aldehyde dehydrogenase family protein [Candidatus Gottesmanbacteria bacterium]
MPEEFFAEISDGKTPPTYKFFNGSQWVEGTNGKTTEIKSPIDGSVVGSLQVVTTAEIDAAMEKAIRSQKAWEATPLNQRVKIMHLAADWIRHFEDYLTTLLVTEIGKTTEEAKSEIKRTADLTDYFADEAQSIHGEEIDSDNFPGYDKGRIAIVERVAHGVVVAIAPFNYPVNLSASKIAPALLVGNSVVFKPPTQGGISGLHLTQIFHKAGVPEGVMSCVTGKGEEIGDYLVGHPKAGMIAFTGSSDTGLAIAAKAPMKPLLFECGGNNPAVVLPDADLALTARELVKGAFSYAGQRCTAIKYVLALPATLDALIPVVLKEAGELVHMGDPRSPETKMVGPVVSLEAAQSVETYINDAVGSGAKVLAGGKRKNTYIEPTILTGVKPNWTICTCEVFGPILSFIPMQSTEEAVTIINGSRYGLQACVFTKDEGTGLNFAKELNVGTVQINGSPQRGPDHFPFLGVKQSGVGVQGVRYSLEAMSRLRPIVLNKPA